MNTLLGADDPKPFELVNSEGRSELVLFCDHASNRVPASLNNLGLSDEQLASHIGWDPGAALLARALSVRLDAPLLLSNYSRLVIDCNRHPTAADSIPTTSDGTEYRKYKRGSQSIPVPVSGKQCLGACRYAGLRGAISGYFALVSAH